MLLWLAAVVAIGYAIVARPAPSRAQAPSKDLWQSYMSAAQASDKDSDTSTEAVALNLALAFANQHDAQGQRPALTRLPLILAYFAMQKQDLWPPLRDQGIAIDVKNADDQLNEYIDTLDNYGFSYYDHWIASTNIEPKDYRRLGAEFSFRREVALRQKLRPGDEVGLASATSLVGLIFKKAGEVDCTDFEYGQAIDTFLDNQQRRDAMATLGNRFSVGQPATASAEQITMGQAIADTQVYLLLDAGVVLMTRASQSLDAKSDNAPAANVDLASKCDDPAAQGRSAAASDFDAQISRASSYFDTVLALTSELRRYWPRHPIFGLVNYRLASLYQLEFKAAKTRPDRYPDALSKSREAYDQALAILAYSDGMDSSYVRSIASDYVDLLNEANLPDEAKQVAQRYGIPTN